MYINSCTNLHVHTPYAIHIIYWWCTLYYDWWYVYIIFVHDICVAAYAMLHMRMHNIYIYTYTYICDVHMCVLTNMQQHTYIIYIGALYIIYIIYIYIWIHSDTYMYIYIYVYVYSYLYIYIYVMHITSLIIYTWLIAASSSTRWLRCSERHMPRSAASSLNSHAWKRHLYIFTQLYDDHVCIHMDINYLHLYIYIYMYIYICMYIWIYLCTINKLLYIYDIYIYMHTYDI